jgi:microcystin-dependent protein
LFAKIGTTWGPGDGSTTYNLPNFVGRALVGVDATGTVLFGNWPLGHLGGEPRHTQTVAEMAAHAHGYTNSQGNINNAQSGGSNPPGPNTGLVTDVQGGGQPFNVTQPSAAIFWLIKA